MNEKLLSKKYQVKREIASGGMGTIYLATDTKLGRDVAIKMLHPQYSGEPAFAQRFLREAWAMAKLDHANIIRIWSVEEEESSHCIVMEYFPGDDLKHIIRSRGPLALTEALSLVTQIIQGLAYAHYMGIIHRDIKPANILVDQEGRVKITDFGIAAAFSESSLTMDGTVMGTPEYMAPEQARAEAVGPHTDLYSAGILLYELLTGKTPYKGIPAQTLVAKLAFGAENPALTFPSSIPVEIQELIKKMTQQRVEDRLTDINEILTITKAESFSFASSQPDSEETVVFSPETRFQKSEEPLTQVATKDQPLSSTQTTNVTPGPLMPPPPKEKGGVSFSPQAPAPSHTRTLILSAIGILTVSVLAVLIVSQWPVAENRPDQIVIEDVSNNQSVNQDTISTAIADIERTAQTIQTTKSKIDQDFELFSSSIQTLQGNIVNTQIPTSYPKSQDWLSKTQKEVAALRKKKDEMVEAHILLLTASKEGLTASREQGETLRKEGLLPDQNEQLQAITTRLKKDQHILETSFANHRQATQAQLTRLEDRFKQTRKFILAKKKTPTKSPSPASKATTKLAALKTEIHVLGKEIKGMFTSFEMATQEFTTQLTNVQSEIKQIQNDLPSDPSSAKKLSGLKEKLRSIQGNAQTFFSQETNRQQKLEQTLQAKFEDYQGFPKKMLRSSQKSDLEKLEAILKENKNSLKTFPPDPWNRLQAESLKIQALIMTTKNMIAQNIEAQREKTRRLAEEKKQKKQKAALEARQKEAAQLAEQQQLATLEAQRQQALVQKEQELQQAEQQAVKNVQLAETVEALKKVLDDFSTAYENRDLLHLQLTTSMSESRTRNLDLMFKSYRTIETHTKIMATSETQAKAKIFIDKLMNREGKSITPNFVIRETDITIPKKDGKWGKIQW